MPASSRKHKYVWEELLCPMGHRIYCGVRQVTIHILPDDVLLDIFGLYRGDYDYFPIGMWKSLVQVCRRWRRIIFASPGFLRLLLRCNARTPVRNLLRTWPPLPIAIRYSPEFGREGEENVIAALELPDRVAGITFDHLQSSEELERFSAAMQKPWPTLTRLRLTSDNYSTPVIVPGFFLDVSAPELRSFTSHNVGFLNLPKLNLSAPRLVTLSLLSIPFYISSETMATYLSTLPCLEEFSVGFSWSSESLGYLPGPRDPPRQTRVVLPALSHFQFKGTSEYLEDFVARIDTPLLNGLSVMVFDSEIHPKSILHVRQRSGLIGRAENFKPLKQAFIVLNYLARKVTLRSPTRFSLEASSVPTIWPITLMAQLCNDLSSLLSNVERLEIRGDTCTPPLVASSDDLDSTPLLRLFHPFTTVRSLYLSKYMAPLVALPTPSGERPTDALPALRDLVLEGL